MNNYNQPAVWFPTLRTGSGADVFTERLAKGLVEIGIRAEITWLPLRAEYAPWTVPVPRPPSWATVAHVNTWLNSRFVPKNLPVVATIHHSVHHPDARVYKNIARAAYHRFWIAPNERRVLRRADNVVAVSHFVAKATRQTLLDVSIQVIHNGIDTNKFRPGNRQYNHKAPFRLLYIGSWIARKGVDLLAPIMRELGDGFELFYTGGPAAERDKKNIPPNMHDIGRLECEDAVVTAMQEADALLFPSRSEGFGLVAAEAMACGLPIVASSGTALDEIIEDKVTGHLCPKDDIKAFVTAILNISSQHEGRRNVAQAARSKFLRKFTMASMIPSYTECYRCAITSDSKSK